MSKMIKVQLPIREDLKEVGDRIAKSYGLSSYQELIRFWTEQARRGNLKVEVQSNDEFLTKEQEEHLMRLEEEMFIAEKNGETYRASSLEEMMNQLKNDDLD